MRLRKSTQKGQEDMWRWNLDELWKIQPQVGFMSTFHCDIVVRIWIEMREFYEPVWEYAVICMWFENVVL